MGRFKKISALLTTAVLSVSCTDTQFQPAAQDDFTHMSGKAALSKEAGAKADAAGKMVPISAADTGAPLSVLANCVPADALIYIGWQGAENLKADYAKSNLKKIIDASEIPGWVSEKTDWLIEKIKKEEPTAEAPLRLALSISGKMWQHPTALYFGPPDFSKMGPNSPPDVRIALVCQAGADTDALMGEVAPLIEKVKKEEDKDVPPLRIFKVGDRTVFTVGRFLPEEEAALGILEGASDVRYQVLNNDPAFKAAMGQVDANAAVTFYADVSKTAASLNAMWEKVPDPDAKEYGPLVVDALGLANFTQIAVTGGFSGKEWMDRGFIGLTGEKRGLGIFFDGKPITDDDLKMVPKDAVAFQTIHLDAARIYDEIRNGIKKVNPAAMKDFDQAIGMVKRTFDLDLRQDVLGPIGDQWLVYRLAQSDVTESGYILIIDLRDEKKFGETRSTVEDILRDRGLGVAEKTTKIGGVDASTLEMTGGTEIVWGVCKGKFIISSHDAFEQAVKQIKAGKTSILDNPNYVALRKALPQVTPVSVDYHEPAVIYPEFARMIAPVLLMANIYGADIPPNLLPDPDKIEKYLTPGGGVSWVDEKGYHSVGRFAFPGATLISGDVKNAATVALLPEFGKVRAAMQAIGW